MENGEKKILKSKKKKVPEVPVLRLETRRWIRPLWLLTPENEKKNQAVPCLQTSKKKKKKTRLCGSAGSVYSTRCCRMLLPGQVAKTQLLGRLLLRNLVGKNKKNPKKMTMLERDRV